MRSKGNIVDGQNILYHYIQKSLLKNEDDFSRELIKHLLIDLSIWIPINFYRRLPIILPYVVRDNSCRIKRENGQDEWGSANSEGFLRDDNSLIKGIMRSFSIGSQRVPAYHGRKLGTGFVASHIWGKIAIDDNCLISSRHHYLNSFVPNLVWLPTQISKLTDREGSYAQRLLQAVSYKIYKKQNLPPEIESIWKVLPIPEGLRDVKVDLNQINYFEVSQDWLTRRIAGLISEIDTITSIDCKNVPILEKVKSSRYLPTLKQQPLEHRKKMNDWLSQYKKYLLTPNL
jgi:hypothetical protein